MKEEEIWKKKKWSKGREEEEGKKKLTCLGEEEGREIWERRVRSCRGRRESDPGARGDSGVDRGLRTEEDREGEARFGFREADVGFKGGKNSVDGSGASGHTKEADVGCLANQRETEKI
ncbi:hypothetical protein KFK09_028942 [Dendrobium nobile]|uniref:Uncharacterized protein n=1 Tax=Dendrobium nobile TaxID=94219 RepID=A0A8T3A4F6_DENNO|nr:hypothetical protein KFK09_028942 [Dendrobium nobile]